MARLSTLKLLAKDIVDPALAERALGLQPSSPTLAFNPERLSGFCAT